MKTTTIFLTFALTATLTFAVSKDNLSLSAQSSINKMERSIASAKKTAITELTALMKNEAHNGNIDKAVTLDKIIKSIDSETSSIITAKQLNNKYTDDILGSWEMEGSRAKISFNEDGSCTILSKRTTDGMSTWKVEGKKLIVTNKQINTTDTYDIPPKKVTKKNHNLIVLEGKSSNGSKRTLFRR